MTDPRRLPIDPYLIDVLMRDLTGHDKSPATYLVYLWLWRQSHGEGREAKAASLQTLAGATGLSKSAVQRAVTRLKRRGLLETRHESRTSAPFYTVLQPWVRSAAAAVTRR